MKATHLLNGIKWSNGNGPIDRQALLPITSCKLTSSPTFPSHSFQARQENSSESQPTSNQGSTQKFHVEYLNYEKYHKACFVFCILIIVTISREERIFFITEACNVIELLARIEFYDISIKHCYKYDNASTIPLSRIISSMS